MAWRVPHLGPRRIGGTGACGDLVLLLLLGGLFFLFVLLAGVVGLTP